MSIEPQAGVGQSAAPDAKSSPAAPITTVVGIGASAGGLTALKEFFHHLPEKTGLAYVVVVHLSPEHKSHLAEVLQPHVQMPVLQVTQDMQIEANHVYVIPPASNLTSVDTHLRLTPLPSRREGRAQIDHFFRTLAATYDGKSIAIVLTGTGTDGARGVREIKAKGGIVIVQDPAEAEYNGMPQSAMATGLVDLVLPLAEIPGAVLRASKTSPEIPVSADTDQAQDIDATLLHRIFALLRTSCGRDFSRYKRSTILRRIARRMQMHSLEKLAAYVDYLKEQPAEVHALSDDLLVTVTSFFRDEKVFEAIGRDIIPKLFQDARPERDIRIWSVGCATGEEAYSLAMLLSEEAGNHPLKPHIQIFATDLHANSLARAREGFYLGEIADEVGEQRLQRFFLKEDSGYRVRKSLRDMVTFAEHNLLSDPPFTRVDMILCRNLLIYLQRNIQQEVIGLMHYALNPGGVLVLGTSEIVEASDLFTVEDKPLCMYRKRNVPPRDVRTTPFPQTFGRRPLAVEALPATPSADPVGYGQMHERMVERYAPPSVLVTPDDKVVHLSEHVGQYLVHPGGEPTTSVLKLVRNELRIELRAALHEARRRRRPSRSKPVLMTEPGGVERFVSLDVRPALDSEQDGFALILFDEREADPAQTGDAGQAPAGTHAELEEARRRLRDVIEQYETSQEAMKAAHEEQQSINEELRSTLEELETSKEELQSMNEELHTVNQENRNKVEELAQLSADLQNLLAASDIATLFLDREFRILRFTPKIAHLFNVRAADRGRPLSDITHHLGYADLIDDATRVLERLTPVEREVQDARGAWYLTRVLLYRSQQDRIEGVVITFVDITQRKLDEDALRVSERRLSAELAAMVRLHDLVGELLNSSDLRSALDKVLIATTEISGAQKGTVHLFKAETGRLELAAQHGFEQPFIDRIRSIEPASDSWYMGSMRQRRRVVIADLETDSEFEAGRAGGVEAGVRALQVTPLLGRAGELLGTLSTYYELPNQPSQRDLRTLDVYSRQAAEFIEHVHGEETLRDIDRRKDEFLAMLGHELRNPLAAILNAVELAKSTEASPAAWSRFQHVVTRQTRNLLRLVDDLLQISRVSRGRIKLRLETVRLSDVLADAVQGSESSPLPADHRIVLDLPGESPCVAGDPPRLNQIFSNLINNALRYTPADGTIRVSLRSDGEFAVVSVRDSGIGIEAENLAHLFEMFYQVSPLRDTSQDGLGIGLALVKSLVDLHGGQVEARSEGRDKGTEFVVRLPLVAAAAQPSAQLSTANPPADASDAEMRRILVVDDLEDAANTLALLLGMSGYETQTAYDGEQAIEVAKRFQPDAVVLDLGLPKVDGYEVARRLRAEADGKRLLLIALTGRGGEEDKARSAGAGFDHFITKPVEYEQLQSLLQKSAPDRA